MYNIDRFSCVLFISDLMARQLRDVKRLDYRKLADCVPIPKEGVRLETWSTKKLYKLEILKSEVKEGHLKFFVHYVGWNKKYDEWRNAEDVLDIPEGYLNSTPEGRDNFYRSLGISVKELLHGQRRVDSAVELRVPISVDIFDELKALGAEKTKKGTFHCDISALDGVLSKGWNWRIFNVNGDFAYVRPGTVSYRLCEREPLVEYSAEGVPNFSHRGFLLVFKFQRLLGNKKDFAQFICA